MAGLDGSLSGALSRYSYIIPTSAKQGGGESLSQPSPGNHTIEESQKRELSPTVATVLRSRQSIFVLPSMSTDKNRQLALRSVGETSYLT